jgi:hypothetical protein
MHLARKTPKHFFMQTMKIFRKQLFGENRVGVRSIVKDSKPIEVEVEIDIDIEVTCCLQVG